VGKPERRHDRRRRSAATGAAYREALDTRRFDAGAVGQTIVGGDYVILPGRRSRMRASVISSRDREHDRPRYAFGEVAVRHATGRQTWVVGAAVERDAFQPE
jgi:hypothetical protein